MKPANRFSRPSVHPRSIHSSSSVHCSSAGNARECKSLLMRAAVAIETGTNHQGRKKNRRRRANEVQGQRSEVAVEFSRSPRDVATVLRSGTAGSLRPFRRGLCNDCLGSHEPLYAPELLEAGRGAPWGTSPAGHEHGVRQPRESEGGISSDELKLVFFSPPARTGPPQICGTIATSLPRHPNLTGSLRQVLSIADSRYIP